LHADLSYPFPDLSIGIPNKIQEFLQLVGFVIIVDLIERGLC